MSRFASYLGIVAAVFVGIVAVALSNLVGTPSATPVATMATTSANLPLSVVQAVTASSTAFAREAPPPASAEVPPASASPTRSEDSLPETPAPVSEQPVAVNPGAATTTAPVAPPVSAPVFVSSGNLSFDEAAAQLRGALVNILCYAPAGSNLRSISGSGIFVDAKGIILTNAHIAQYFLLADKGVSCTIRTGGPATDKYKAALIFISPSWVQANPSVVTESLPSGTGEYDFALLAVTASVDRSPLPSSFPFVPLAELPPASGAPIVIASYGAQFLQTSQVQSALYPTVVFGSIKEILTFTTTTADVLALGGSAAAQEGSSGGGVADISGTLVGTITTSTVEGATATRKLNALTASYIRSEYARETGGSLTALLATPTNISIANFAPQIAPLESLITTQLN